MTEKVEKQKVTWTWWELSPFLGLFGLIVVQFAGFFGTPIQIIPIFLMGIIMIIVGFFGTIYALRDGDNS